MVAMLVGLCALYITWDQSQVMRKQQHAAVWPLLSLNIVSIENENSVGIMVEAHNDGVGPALIKSVQLYNKDQNIQNIQELKKVFPKPLDDFTYMEASFNTATGVLGAGDSKPIFSLKWPDTSENRAAIQLWLRSLAKRRRDVNLDICYCSVFDRCWSTINQTSIRDNSVKRCRSEGEDFSGKMIATLNEIEENKK